MYYCWKQPSSVGGTVNIGSSQGIPIEFKFTTFEKIEEEDKGIGFAIWKALFSKKSDKLL